MKTNPNCKVRSRVFLLLLALAMLLSVCLTACGDKNDGNDKTPSTSGNSPTDYAAEAGVDSNWTYDDQTFTFFIGSDGWVSDDIWDDEDSNVMKLAPGEPVYDAVMQRVLLMEELYGCKIAVTGQGEGTSAQSTIETHLNAGDNAFQAISTSGDVCYRLAVGENLWDFTQWDNLDLSASYWDQEFVDQMTINGHLYFLLGEYSRRDNQMTHAIAFNKRMCGKYEGLPETSAEFYQLVKDGKWTLDKMFEYAQLVTGEVDGDGKLTENDRIGLLYRQTSVYGFLQGSGINIASKDSNGELQLTFWSDKTATLWEKLMDMATSSYAMNTDKDAILGDSYIDAKKMMEEDRCLFFCEYIHTFEEMRKQDIEFGILPFPKYDEAQEQYISASHDYGTNFLCVPIMNLDTENTANILSIFSYMGQEMLTPAYYENVLYGKTVKDEESREMLDLIFETKHYDLGTYMNWSEFSKKLMNGVWNEKSTALSSFYNSYEKRVKRQIDTEMNGAAFSSLT